MFLALTMFETHDGTFRTGSVGDALNLLQLNKLKLTIQTVESIQQN